MGIGTTSPLSILDIHDPTSSATTLTLGRSGEVPTIKAGGTNTDLRLEAVGPGGWMEFLTNNSSRMRITADGNVGIGTETPDATFEVHNSGPGADARFKTTSNRDLNIELEAGTNNNTFRLIVLDEADKMYISSDTTNPIMTFLDNGYVGIGTTNPVYNLHVADADEPNLLIQRTTPDGNVPGLTLNSVGTAGINNRTGDVSLMIVDSVGDSEPVLRFSTTNGASPTKHTMFITNGNVGIGTSHPSQLLEVRTPGGKYGCHIEDDQGQSLGGFFVSEEPAGEHTDGLELYLKQGGSSYMRFSPVKSSYLNTGERFTFNSDPDEATKHDFHIKGGNGVSREDTTVTLGVNRVGPIVGSTDTHQTYHKAAYFTLHDCPIDSGGVDNGYRIAVDGSAYMSSTSFKGYLKQAIGVWARAGTYNNPNDSNQSPTGTIDEAISLYVDCLWGSGTTINNSYGVYQRSNYYSDPDISKNFFHSRVGIGVTDPEAKLHVQIPGYGDLAYFQDGSTGRGLKISQNNAGTWITHGGGDNLYFQNNVGLKALEIRNDGGTRIYNAGSHTYYAFENNNEINAKNFSDGASTKMCLNWAGGDISLGKNIEAKADGDLHSVKLYIGGTNDTRYADSSGDGGITLADKGTITAANGPVLQISKNRGSGWANAYFNIIDPDSNGTSAGGNRYIDFMSDGVGAFSMYGDSNKNFYIHPNDTNTSGNIYLNSKVHVDDGLYVDNGDIFIRDVGPVVVLQDTNSTTTTNQVGYVSFRNGADTETAWVGFGSNSDDTFRIRNAVNTPILIQTANQIRVGNSNSSDTVYADSNDNLHTLRARMVVDASGAASNIANGDSNFVTDFQGSSSPWVGFTDKSTGKRVGYIQAISSIGMRIANDQGSHVSDLPYNPKIDLTKNGVIIEASNSDNRYETLKVIEQNSHGGVVVDTPANKQAHLRFLNNGTHKWQIRCPFHESITPDSMRIYSWSAGGDVMTFKNNGNVGIGTIDPDHTLTVHSSQNQPFVVSTNNANTWMDLKNAAGSWSIGNNGQDFSVYSRFGGATGEGTFLQVTLDGQTKFAGALNGLTSWGGARIHHPSGTEGGWGAATASNRYPHIGSWGSQSLIMLENPHIPWRTDNPATGTTGRAGIRLEDPAKNNYWDVGLMNYSEGTFFHVYNSGLSTNKSLIKTDPVGNTEIAGRLEARQHSDWTHYGQIDRVRYQGDIITIEHQSSSGYTALLYGNIGTEVNAFSRAARLYTDFTASVEFRTADDTHLGIMFGAQEDSGAPQDNNYSVIIRPYLASGSATQAGVRIQKRNGGSQSYILNELATGYLMNDDLWHTLHVSVRQPDATGSGGWIVIHVDEYKYFEAPFDDTTFTTGSVGLTTYHGGSQTSFRNFKVDRKRVLNSVGATQIAGAGALESRFEMVRLDSGSNNDPVFQFRAQGGAYADQALGGFWWSNINANNWNVAMQRVRTTTSDGKFGRFEWAVADNTSWAQNSKTPNMELQREWLRVYGDNTNISGDTMKYPQIQLIGERTDGYGSGIDIVAGDLSSGACNPFIRFYDTAHNNPFSNATGDLSWAIGCDDAGASTFKIVSAIGGDKLQSIAGGSTALLIHDVSLEVGIPNALGVGMENPSSKFHVYQSASSNNTSRANMARWELNDNSNVNFDIFGDAHANRPGWFQIGGWNADVGIAIVSDTLADVEAGTSTNGIFIKNDNVGIGTQNPSSKFEIVGTNGQLFSVVDDMSGIIFSVNDSSGIPSLEVEDNGNVYMTEFGGKVVVGKPTYTSALMNVGGAVDATAHTTNSDQALKTNIQPITDAVDKVKQIGGYTFDMNTDGRESTGVIAQEIEKVLPQVVFGEEGSKSVSYGNIVGLLIEAIKEQQQTIESQNERIDALEQQLK